MCMTLTFDSKVLSAIRNSRCFIFYLHIISKRCPIGILGQVRCLIVSIPNRSHYHCATSTYEHSQSNQIKEEFSLLAVRQILCDLDI